MRIDFLSDQWTKDQAKAGKLPVTSVTGPQGQVVSATTDELRKFALAHAEDTEAFSEAMVFQRKK